MSNGLSNSFDLGVNRCCFVLALATLSVFADFDSSDSQVLQAINTKLTSIGSSQSAIQVYQANISHNSDSIPDIALMLQTQYGYQKPVGSYIEQMGDDLHELAYSFTYSNGEHFVASRDLRLEASANSIDRKISTITNQNELILAAINNLTNYLAYSPNYVSAINTNLPAILVNGSIYPFGGYDTYEAMYIFDAVYGRFPTIQELHNFESASYYGLWRYLVLDYSMKVSLERLSDFEYPDEESFNEEVYDAFAFDYFDNSGTKEMSKAYYYLYGTRDIVNAINLMTNDANFSVSVTGDTNSTYSSGFVKSASGLAGSALSSSMVDGTLSQIDTNAITQRADGAYSQPMGPIQGGISDTMTSDLSDSVSGIMQVASDFVPTGDDDDTYTFDFGTWTLFGSEEKPITMTISKIPDSILAIIHYVFLALRLGVVIILAFDIWHFMCAETEL